MSSQSINQLLYLAGFTGERETAAVANLDAVEETAGLGQQLQHVGQGQEGDIPKQSEH